MSSISVSTKLKLSMSIGVDQTSQDFEVFRKARTSSKVKVALYYKLVRYAIVITKNGFSS